MRRKLTSAHAFVALGANLPSEIGEPVDTLRKALAALIPHSQHLPVISGFYESDPKDCPPASPIYVNAVVALLPLPEEDPFSLLDKLQHIEKTLGRIRTGLRNEARVLDLDLLTFATVQCATPDLTLPHPRAHERRFVLEPWVEIAGSNWKLAGETLGHWLRECTDPPLHRLPD
jgi:2-amino-4-hydroxy-6-hydroxymethyldihydropteridine diphosphokinase